MITLRPYQVDAIEAVRATIRSGKRRPVFVLPTGGGKTVIASSIIVGAISKGTYSLFVAHRRELIKQAFAKLVRSGIDPQSIGIIMAGIPTGAAPLFAADIATLSDDELWARYARRRPMALVQVASIDTLRNRARLSPAPSLIIIDEAHRALAKGYRDLVEAYPGAIVIGLTATPYRADRKGLGELFTGLVVGGKPADLVANGSIIEPRVFTVSALPDLSSVKVNGGDYDTIALDQAVNRGELVGDIVEHWQRAAQGRRTVAFAASVAHSKHIVRRFVDAGVAAEHLDGTTPTPERESILARLASGKTSLVANCGVLCEGWDMPAVKCLILARPTKSLGLFLQMAGRILRPWEDISAIILDHAGSVYEHGFPTEEREFSLAPPKKRKKSEAMPFAKTCPECMAVLPPATAICPECDHVFELAPKDAPEESAGELVEVTRDEFNRQKFAKWDALLMEWHGENQARMSANRKPLEVGWLWIEYTRRHKCNPPKGSKYPKHTAAQKLALAKHAPVKMPKAPKLRAPIVEYEL